jgi:hypothetical protein
MRKIFKTSFLINLFGDTNVVLFFINRVKLVARIPIAINIKGRMEYWFYVLCSIYYPRKRPSNHRSCIPRSSYDKALHKSNEGCQVSPPSIPLLCCSDSDKVIPAVAVTSSPCSHPLLPAFCSHASRHLLIIQVINPLFSLRKCLRNDTVTLLLLFGN